jgi:hypothetical protein
MTTSRSNELERSAGPQSRRTTSMSFRCFRCEHPGYCQVPESSLIRCARCNLIQAMDLATSFLVKTPDAARLRPLPRRWRPIPGRRLFKNAILLSCVVGASGVAGLTTEVLRARPPAVLRPAEVTASPPSPTSGDRTDLGSEHNRLRRRLGEPRNLVDRAEQPRPAEFRSVPRAPRPERPEFAHSPTGADLSPRAVTAGAPPQAPPRSVAVESRSIPIPARLGLDPTARAGDGWWAEPDSTPGIRGCTSAVADCIVSEGR